MGGTTVYGSRAITVDTGGALNVVLAAAAGDDFTVDTDKLVVSGDTGDIGIGVAAPQAKLHILSASAGTHTPHASADELVIEGSSSTGLTIVTPDAQNGAVFWSSPSRTGNIGARVQYNYTSDIMTIGQITGGAAIALQGANTGVGTLAPVSLLDVRGPTGTGATPAGLLTLSTAELTVADNDQLGRVDFRAPLATAGTDAILTAASIWAEANATFSASVNAADIVFATATSGAVAEAMRITSTGRLGLGTTAPQAPLSVSNGGAAGFELNPALGTIITYNRSTSAYAPVSLNGSSIDFFIAAASKMSVSAAGDVNIKQELRVGTSSGTSAGTIAITTGGSSPYPNKLTFGTDGTGWGFAIASNQGGSVTNRLTVLDNGNVVVGGSLSKSSGSFRISHPLPAKSETTDLVHSFIEGPRADLIYRGTVTLVAGAAVVDLDDAAGMSTGTWVMLCRDAQVHTSNETGWYHVRGTVIGSTLTIECENGTCTDTVSWLVVAERQDQHMLDTDWTDETGRVIVEPLREPLVSPSPSISPSASASPSA